MFNIKDKQPVICYGYDVTANASILAEFCEIFGITSDDVVKIGEDGYSRALLSVSFGDVISIDKSKLGESFIAAAVLFNGASPGDTDNLTLSIPSGDTGIISIPRSTVRNITYSMM